MLSSPRAAAGGASRTAVLSSYAVCGGKDSAGISRWRRWGGTVRPWARGGSFRASFALLRITRAFRLQHLNLPQAWKMARAGAEGAHHFLITFALFWRQRRRMPAGFFMFSRTPSSALSSPVCDSHCRIKSEACQTRKGGAAHWKARHGLRRRPGGWASRAR